MDNFIKSNDMDNDKGYSIHEIYYLLKKHIKIIFIVFCLCFAYFIYSTFNASYIYGSMSTIIINKDANSRSFLDMGLLQADRNFIDNEIAILGSRTTSDLVVEKLLNSEHRDNLYLFGTKKRDSNFFDFLKSENNDDVDIPSNFNKFSKNLRNSIHLANDRKTDAIVISLESLDPDEAALLINTLVDVYIERDLGWATGEMNHLKLFLYEQLKQKQIELKQIEEELKIFQEKEKIFGLDDRSNMILENLKLYETEYNNILAAIDIINEKERYLKSQLNDDEKELSDKISNATNERLIALKKELTKIEEELIASKTKHGENHPAVSLSNEKIEQLKKEIDSETKILIKNGISVANPISYRQSLMDSLINIGSIKSNLVSKSNAYKKLVQDYENKLTLLPEKLLNFTRLQRDRAIKTETFSFMSQKLEEAKIGEASKISKIRIVDRAIPQNNPVKPNKKKDLIIGFIFSLFIGIGVAMIYELLDNTINSLEQIERRGLEVLAMIPSIGQKNDKDKTKKYISKNKNVNKIQRRLIMHEDPKSPVSEAYRGLRTSLLYSYKNSECNVILVSSPGPGEGKTTTIANLAITYANLGKKTILVDSDLRKPVVHKIFDLDKSPGLTSYLSNNSSFDKIVRKTDVENLDVISSGVNPPNPSELLESNKMNELFKKLRSCYDIVLFDSPPLVAVTDAYVLLKHINQFILVIRAGVTERGALKRVLATTSQADFKIDGVVMNAITEQAAYGSGYYYNYYQYYYGEK
tara:strand:+ start:1448 stop:3712 length:2265 start_codon:yes stop_codon:yes gene_type:complete